MAHSVSLQLPTCTAPCQRSLSSSEATSSSSLEEASGRFSSCGEWSRRVKRMQHKLAARSAAQELMSSMPWMEWQPSSSNRRSACGGLRKHRLHSLSGNAVKGWWEEGVSSGEERSLLKSGGAQVELGLHENPCAGYGWSGEVLEGRVLDRDELEEELVLESETATWREHKVHMAPAQRARDAGVPVYIMLPLDTVTIANTLTRQRALRASLSALKSAGVDGVMMDVWWGIVEREGPHTYDWAAYRELVGMVRDAGLKLQAVMSFHQCGGNVGDHCMIPLPPWVLSEMEADPDLMYTDKAGRRNSEYISLGCDLLPVLAGRTPLQVYADFMREFRDEFQEFLGEVITEIQVGMGPAGELRYPAYPESNDKWRFPGIGEFQCYDSYMLASLRAAAEAAGKPHWGFGGPHDAGYYNQWPNETGFFHTNGSWNHPYGQFFLQWYSETLERHGDRILASAAAIFREFETTVSGKVAGIHWHYGTHSHAAELTAGYYNTAHRDGYAPLARMFARHGATLNFTCIEMRDAEQPMCAMCSPEGLLRQVVAAAKATGVRVSGENALPRFDEAAHEQIVWKSRLQLEGAEMEEPMCCFTFLRMSERLFRPDNWRNFVLFVRHMREGRTFLPWERHADQHHHLMQPSFLGPLHEAAEALMLQS